MSETFGRRLARWRETAGLTQGELAGRVGVTPTYICHLEREVEQAGVGEWQRPLVEVVDSIAAALDVPLAEVRCAAGYDPPEETSASCEVVRNTFGGSDFAELHQMYERLTPERRTQFRPIIQMVGRELEMMLKEQEGHDHDGKRAELRVLPDASRHHPRRPGRPRPGGAEPPPQHDRRRQT